MAERTVTSIVPPRLASLPAERGQLEYSSRSISFVGDGRRLLRAWGAPERPWILGIEDRGSRWTVTAWGADPPAARAAARALFSLDHPLEEFYRRVRAEPILRGTDRRFRGLRLPRDASLYEALLHAIVGQQLSVAAAKALIHRLRGRTAAWVEVDGIEVPVAPFPSRLGALSEDELRRVGLSGAKARALRALAAGEVRSPAAGAAIGRRPLDDAVAALEALPGVGRWTAENALLRGIGRTDVFVAGDLGIRVALAEYGAVPRSAPEARARRWGDRYYPGWGSYATLYLWRKLVADRIGSPAG